MNRHRRALQLIADARPAALDDAPDRPAPYFPDLPAGARSALRSRRRLVLAALLPAAAAGLVAVALIVSTSHTPGAVPEARPEQSAPPAEPVTARAILLAAAEKTAALAPETGGYWVTEQEMYHLYDVGGYRVLGRNKVETWHAMRAGGQFVIVTRWLGAAPATDADQAAWAAAGSPKQWTSVGPEGKPGRQLSAEPGTRKVGATTSLGFELAGRKLTYAQIQALPTDPDGLKAYLIKADDETRGELRPGELERWRVEMLFSSARNLLTELPVGPPVRAATYRMLAGLPGLKLTENVRDEHGRTGAGIGYAYRNADGSTYESTLVIDPRSGALLALKEPSSSVVMLGDRFTDTPPPRS
ncbi:CU044_5270 family protein [Catellatospora citrea]|uniref:CU044_5270 family protein n=1 Tax=Catellatospora citrea TaxID=53366 RepID=A0A8J3KKR5_9ACTN|nr:CU044_5270 family protein [Catellatospora citrea]RKE12201.1 hypothetical protein C8E86_7138 [Catellatospora citrea]GIF98835.1 hypothetical protein Cci01nite_39290 [Catellatospora citrea]